MRLRSLMIGIKNYFKEIKSFSKQKEIPTIKLMADCLYSFFRYGCRLNQYTVGRFYLRKGFERKRILTYRVWKKIIKKYNSSHDITTLKNKIEFNNFFKDFIKREWIYCKEMTFDDFYFFLKKHKIFVAKPNKGSEGDGVRIIDANEKDPKDLYKQLIGEDLILEQYIYQHKDMIFGNKSVNTVRIYTVYNPQEKKAIIIKAVVRAGIGDSIVDNSHAGGCAYEIDKDHGYIISKSYEANGLTHYIHPGTQICMLGRAVPYWENVKEICIQAAENLPNCQFIGWDIAVTDKGPLIVEGNHSPDLDMVEFVGSFGYLDIILSNISRKN